jgi:protein SCO1/2
MNCRHAWMVFLWGLALLVPAAGAAVPAVEFEQRLGERLPLSLRFTEADGSVHALAQDLVGRPAVLMFGYYHCRNLCDTSLDALARAVETAPLRAGGDADILFLSIDPQENAATAAAKQQAYARAFPQAGVARWHFLTGDAAAIAALAQAAGFHFGYNPRRDEYLHPAGLVLLTAQGSISRYLPGAAVDPAALRSGVREAGRGRIGSLAQRVWVLCHSFDDGSATAALVLRLVRWLSLAAVAGLVLLVMAMSRRAARSNGHG